MAAIGQENMRSFHGIAAADKADDSRELLVYCEELLPFLSGEIVAMEVDSEIAMQTGTSKYLGSIKTTNVLRCIYRDSDSNRAFPPKVRKGEQVLIYNYGDTNTWYWKSEGRDEGIRRLDTYRQAVSGTREYTTELGDDNTYFLEIDTRGHKRIRLMTSQADGEKHRYIFTIDVDGSNIFLGDDIGNQIYLDSEHPRVCMKNSDNSLIDLNRTNIVIACDNDISIISKNGEISTSSKKNTSIRTDTNLVMEVASHTSLKSGGNISTSASGNTSISSGSNTAIRAGAAATFHGATLGLSWDRTSTCTSQGTMTMSIGGLNVNKYAG